MATLYEQDFYAWTLDQAERLRRARDQGSNLDLDWPHLIEEVESLAGNERRALTGDLMRVLEHLAKLSHSPATRPRRGWQRSVALYRAEIELLLEQSPSLQPLLPEILPRAWKLARRLAVKGLATDRMAGQLSVDCPFTLQEALDADWYPEPPVRH